MLEVGNTIHVVCEICTPDPFVDNLVPNHQTKLMTQALQCLLMYLVKVPDNRLVLIKLRNRDYSWKYVTKVLVNTQTKQLTAAGYFLKLSFPSFSLSSCKIECTRFSTANKSSTHWKPSLESVRSIRSFTLLTSSCVFQSEQVLCSPHRISTWTISWLLLVHSSLKGNGQSLIRLFKV